MPIMDGRATISAVQTIDPGIKVVVTSGLRPRSELDDGVVSVVKAFLEKPYTAETLLKTVQEALHPR
ncbi:MAG: hypothetical protein ACYDH9_10670 [Limisphaerales bacterium]